MLKDWTKTFAEDLWLKPDDVGAEEAAFIARALHLRPGQAVLDAPCGAGRIAIHIAQLGCSVTGIDFRASFTNRAASRFRSENLIGRFLPMDLREMEFSGEYDAVFSWLGSFGYFAEAENLDVLKRYAAALRKGGRILVDQPNREAMLRHFRVSYVMGGCTIKNRWNEGEERLESDWVAKRNGRKEHNRMSIRLYTPGQMCRLFQQAGLTVEAMYGSRNGELYKRSSKRLIVVGR
jgi:SAM-dependent methyltransferase